MTFGWRAEETQQRIPSAPMARFESTPVRPIVQEKLLMEDNRPRRLGRACATMRKLLQVRKP